MQSKLNKLNCDTSEQSDTEFDAGLNITYLQITIKIPNT
jgi:hypothetical protein